ncbi:hypothetical protein CROQUDRAFT_136707 [Cronartium quercuum f. sp. fusiforme G11]|uniref:Uncharacterized protein n=1 Tax=Cronartium quercuum f. sp. fusiforme G11 TaxID=708437 RepID=A0A9P6N6E7_9BASI|nr:hypothetical protein CROQUDRAFT_136707 [Cronartium quercuum f. sp. fusiforme G11]
MTPLHNILSNLSSLKCLDVFMRLRMEASRNTGPETASVFVSRAPASAHRMFTHGSSRPHLAVGNNPKDRCHLLFHSHLNHTNGDCYKQASNSSASEKPHSMALKSSTTLTNAEKSRCYDEEEDPKEKHFTHLAVYENKLAYITHLDSSTLNNTIIADCTATKHISGDHSLFMSLQPIPPVSQLRILE